MSQDSTPARGRRPLGPSGARLLTTMAQARALDLAGRTGLLRLLARADGPVPDPAAALSLDPETTALVLQVLIDADVVSRGPDGFRARPWLVEAESELVGGVDGTVQALGAGPEFLQQGALSAAFRQRSYSPETVLGLASMFGAAAAGLAAALPKVDGAILDLGAGSATWSLQMAAQAPGARVVAVDRAPVLEAARLAAGPLGLSDRLQAVAADLTCDPWPAGPFPRVVLANVLHLFRPPAAAGLVERAAAALAAGGQLVVVDAIGSVGDPTRDAYALQLRMRQPHGTVHPVDELCAWMRAAGLRDPQVLPLSTQTGGVLPLGAIVATAPESP
ncbi:MAG: methyltransferase domain-containing protein [Alphaproteobacteria bacterium]|nr:methyltransferase domain-containing protein [Alphaproteobacteria bacterium]